MQIQLVQLLDGDHPGEVHVWGGHEPIPAASSHHLNWVD